MPGVMHSSGLLPLPVTSGRRTAQLLWRLVCFGVLYALASLLWSAVAVAVASGQ